MKTLSEFTNQYSLSKTLRFELKPIGKDGERLLSEKATNFFAEILEQDREIKKAYDALKPVMDKIHENIINTSMTSAEAKQIDFTEYFEEYKKGKVKKLDDKERFLREKVGNTFDIAANKFANGVGNDEKGKPIFKKNKKDEDVGVKYLTQQGILKYIENNIATLVSEKDVKEFIDKREVTEKGKIKNKKTGYLEVFSSFFTYFTGYNQNRENYYLKDEKATAVATRIVHENLPKFCDNVIKFKNREDDYKNALQYLKNNNRETQIKDRETNKIIEAKAISENWFKIDKFSDCLAQMGINEYNKIIGHYNLLINLYNQARKREKDFKKLDQFKILWKQIGSGKRKALFDALKYYTKQEQQKANEKSNEPLSLEEMLQLINIAGKKYFKKSTVTNNKTTIYDFIQFLKSTENWDGIYWSKAAVDIVSNRYLANWYSIKELIETGLKTKDKKEVFKSVASYNKKREEQLKINDAVELSGLFKVLDQEQDKGWSQTFFKDIVLENHESLIDENKAPSHNLINLICADMKGLAKEFCSKSESILKIIDYKKEENILEIKHWLDTAKSLLWIVKYFLVKENKIKGTPVNAELTNMLTELLYAEDTDWFRWYNLVRNYLSKKPQDDAKKNKLKLNFENPILLGGWSDGQEKNKSAVLLKNRRKYYLGILSSGNRNIFDTEKENNSVYITENTEAGRLILRNLKFQTLAGKGFLGKYGESYGTIGQTNPDDAVTKLQEFIKDNYVQKYPGLKSISEQTYSDKKEFDASIKNALTECYECYFKPIVWDTVLKFVEDEKIYLFEIYSKDFSDKKGIKSKNSNINLQTKYWEHIFQDNSTIQLNGGGELFFREKVNLQKNDKAIHPANIPIKRRIDGKTESRFSHDIIKNKRFTTDKYFFHIPIKINYRAPSRVNINEKVNKMFIQEDDILFLGIDRGEKHLIYYSLVDVEGKIIEQNHFDIINEKDYLQEINKAAKRRREKQENWQQKGNISNLKDGYISLVIHEIIQKMKDKDGKFKPTFIVLENLNKGFKRSRQKFEQQVYQKFELALAKKLNYLVDKKAKMGKIGSVAKALQLTPTVENYQDIENRKQLGIMLYTRANYTSVTDPVTGWRKTIYLKKGKEEDIKKQILNAFLEIGVDKQGDYFFQYIDENTKKIRVLWSGKDGKSLERYRGRRGKDKNEYIVESYDVKDLLDKLFIDFDKSISLKKQLGSGKELSKVNEHTAWETFRFVIDIIQQIRNSGDTTKGQDDNFLHSPVRNEEGEHFDSRKFEKQENPNLPKDADANGAYNIARKGIVMYEHVMQWIKDGKQKFNKYSDLDLFISDKEWDMWNLDRVQWKKQLQSFASKKLKENKQ